MDGFGFAGCFMRYPKQDVIVLCEVMDYVKLAG
jgi:hypothetical protein